MARLHLLPLTIFLALVFARHALCSDSPLSSPSPAPALPADAPSAPSPSPLASISSPPAPPPSDLSQSSSVAPAPSPANSTSPSPSPSPAPGIAGISHTGVADEEAEPESSGGMSAGKKAGIAIGVIACASFVVFGAMLYKKRQQNIRRSQYGSAVRREFL